MRCIKALLTGVAAVPLLFGGGTALPAGASVPLDTTAPRLSVEHTKRFVLGTQVTPSPWGHCGPGFPVYSSATVEVRWRASDAGSGIAGYDVYEAYPPWDDSAYQLVVSGTTQARYQFASGDYDSACGGGADDKWVKIVARDRAGNQAIAYTGELYRLAVHQEDGTGISSYTRMPVTATGAWAVARCACFVAKKTWYSTQAGSSLTYTNPFRAIAGGWVSVVMPKSINRGKVSIRLDNRPAAVVDTYSRTTENAMVVWQARFRTGGNWTLTITNLGTPGHPRVDVDAIMLS